MMSVGAREAKEMSSFQDLRFLMFFETTQVPVCYWSFGSESTSFAVPDCELQVFPLCWNNSMPSAVCTWSTRRFKHPLTVEKCDFAWIRLWWRLQRKPCMYSWPAHVENSMTFNTKPQSPEESSRTHP